MRETISFKVYAIWPDLPGRHLWATWGAGEIDAAKNSGIMHQAHQALSGGGDA